MQGICFKKCIRAGYDKYYHIFQLPGHLNVPFCTCMQKEQNWLKIAYIIIYFNLIIFVILYVLHNYITQSTWYYLLLLIVIDITEKDWRSIEKQWCIVFRIYGSIRTQEWSVFIRSHQNPLTFSSLSGVVGVARGHMRLKGVRQGAWFPVHTHQHH